MNEEHKVHEPPPGIKLDYDEVHAVGTSGPLDDQALVRVLQLELAPRIYEGQLSIDRSWAYLDQGQHTTEFLRMFGALREITQVYPATMSNWHSGERIPLSHAEEVASDGIVLAFQAHYKYAYKSLRDLLELAVLQAYFYKLTDKSLVGRWGRGESRTPGLKVMLKQLSQDTLYSSADNQLNISSEIARIYDDLGAYIHTRGVATISMGLTGSNVAKFTPDALSRFLILFSATARLCVVFLAAFFPASIIYVPAFRKFGYLAPTWLPDEDQVNAIRNVLSRQELQVLEVLAENNVWFKQIVSRVDERPDLNESGIRETYDQLNVAKRHGPEYFNDMLKETNRILE